MLTVQSSITPLGPDSFYTEKWEALVEDHIDYLINHDETQIVPLDGITGFHYQYDFFSLLFSLGVSAEFHWAVMRVNGLTSSSDFNENIRQVILPSTNELVRLNRFTITQ